MSPLFKQPEVEVHYRPPGAPEGWTGVVEYAGLFRRLGAFIVDLILVGMMRAVFGMVAGEADSTGLLTAFSLALYVLYGALMEASPLQATVGKLLVTCEVTDIKGYRLDFIQALLRNTVKFFSIALFGIGCLIVAFTPRKQALHDLLTNCLVLRAG